ncbi:MAG: formate dehydrogenase accessory sulfurtransferase FdhD [Steroidobacteraceae bacterium]
MSAKLESPPVANEVANAVPLHSEVRVQRWSNGKVVQTMDQVAEERPVALTYQGIPHVVMLATPADLEDLAVGFTLSEAVVQSADEIQSVQLFNEGGALEVRIGITGERFTALLRRQRNLSGRTGCGLCGAETIEQAIRNPEPVSAGPSVSVTELHAVLAELTTHQPLNAQTGSVHAAAWVLPGKGIQVIREDVGRHNALDKVIGALIRAGVDCTLGYLVITSRASYEMVQKAATLGVTLVAAVSAPTAMAVELAEKTGLTLIGFARTQQHVVYSHAQRLRD